MHIQRTDRSISHSNCHYSCRTASCQVPCGCPVRSHWAYRLTCAAFFLSPSVARPDYIWRILEFLSFLGFIGSNCPPSPVSALVRSPYTESPQGHSPPRPEFILFTNFHAAALSSQKALKFQILI